MSENVTVTATNTIRLVLGVATASPSALGILDWSDLLESARTTVTTSYLRGFASLESILLCKPFHLGIDMWAPKRVVLAGLQASKFKLHDRFLQCAVISDERIPRPTIADRAKRQRMLNNSEIILSKKGLFWKMDASWLYRDPTVGGHANPWGFKNGEPWLELESVRLEFLGLGNGPLGRTCKEKSTLSGKLVGLDILRTLFTAQRETTLALRAQMSTADLAERKLLGYLERLGEAEKFRPVL